jgi:glycosyltransferase involved in cell wall biosynthesis
MSYIILGDLFRFPEGNAATNRVFTYARGLEENGVSTHVICFINDYIKDSQGTTDGIKYYHPFRQQIRSNYFLIRRWRKLLKYKNTFEIISEIDRNDKIKAIVCYSNLFITVFFSFILAKYFRAKLLLEINEHPMQGYLDNSMSKSLGKIKLNIESRLSDSIICISQYLIDYYRNIGISGRKLFLIPGTVDYNRFSVNYETPLPYEYIAYCGSLTLLKDGVNILIESFSKISDKFPDLRLVLIGKGNSAGEEAEIRKLVVRLKKEDRIIFAGQISRAEIPAYLTNAKILALARPKSMIADAGFPSKLTEYLATGKPVAVTDVGEIPNYLVNNVNAFLSVSDNVDSFADVLEQILINYEDAQMIGIKGKELVKTIFNYNHQAKRMIEYIGSLN